MDSESQKRFDEITAKGPDALDEGEKDFVRARRGYLSKEQAEKFAEILDGSEPSNPYEKLSLAKLKKAAKDRDIEVADEDNREAIIAALTEADAAGQ